MIVAERGFAEKAGLVPLAWIARAEASLPLDAPDPRLDMADDRTQEARFRRVERRSPARAKVLLAADRAAVGAGAGATVMQSLFGEHLPLTPQTLRRIAGHYVG